MIGPLVADAPLTPASECTHRQQEKVKELIGIKESDTGLSLPSQWDLVSDKQMMQVRVLACVGMGVRAWVGIDGVRRPSPCLFGPLPLVGSRR